MKDSHSGIAGVSWISQQMGLSRRQIRRLCAQQLIPGIYRSQKRGKWRVRKIEFLRWQESRKAILL